MKKTFQFHLAVFVNEQLGKGLRSRDGYNFAVASYKMEYEMTPERFQAFLDQGNKFLIFGVYFSIQEKDSRHQLQRLTVNDFILHGRLPDQGYNEVLQSLASSGWEVQRQQIGQYPELKHPVL